MPEYLYPRKTVIPNNIVLKSGELTSTRIPYVNASGNLIDTDKLKYDFANNAFYAKATGDSADVYAAVVRAWNQATSGDTRAEVQSYWSNGGDSVQLISTAFADGFPGTMANIPLSGATRLMAGGNVSNDLIISTFNDKSIHFVIGNNTEVLEITKSGLYVRQDGRLYFNNGNGENLYVSGDDLYINDGIYSAGGGGSTLEPEKWDVLVEDYQIQSGTYPDLVYYNATAQETNVKHLDFYNAGTQDSEITIYLKTQETGNTNLSGINKILDFTVEPNARLRINSNILITGQNDSIFARTLPQSEKVNLTIYGDTTNQYDRQVFSEIQPVSSSASAVYTNPSSTKSLVDSIILHNSEDGAEDVAIYAGSSASDASQVGLFTVSGHDTLFLDDSIIRVLTGDGEQLFASSDTADQVNIMVFGTTGVL